jgi:peptide deformylase
MKLPDPSRLRIILYPDPILKKRAKEVGKPALSLEGFNADIEALARRMLELMHEAKGLGLAAPQVGVGLRLFVGNPTGEPGDDLICVNPRLAELSGGEEKEEGCLSIPGVTVTMRRATQVVLEAFDAAGKPFRATGTDLRARVWQHEIDHLDGRLIIDNMSATDEIANRRAIKQLQDQYRPPRRS